MTITPQQCRAARALTEIDQDTLSEKAGVPRETVHAFEADRTGPNAPAVAAIERALEALGIEFIPEADASGVGVRLKFGRAESHALSTWEDEGGEPAEDNIP